MPTPKLKSTCRLPIEHVKVLGGDINNPSPLLPLRAPISGAIVDQQITGGTGVRSLDNQHALFTIADLSQVWVVCDVYQDMLARVHVGDIAEISVDGYPHDEFPGNGDQHQRGDGSQYAHRQSAHRVAQSQPHHAGRHVRDGYVSRSQ